MMAEIRQIVDHLQMSIQKFSSWMLENRQLKLKSGFSQENIISANQVTFKV